MNQLIDPKTIAPPRRDRYSHAFVIPPGARILITSGTVGVLPNGEVPTDFAGQMEALMSNLTELLKAADMDWNDVVKFTGYLKPQCEFEVFAAIRHRYFGPIKPAMTLAWVSGLVDPRWLIEIEIVAAKQ